MTRKLTYARILPIFVSLFALHTSSLAGGNSLGTAGAFNAFIFDSATINGGGESEGAIAVGGIGVASNANAFTANANYNTLIRPVPATIGSLTNIGLYVNGNVNFANGGQLNNGGNAYVSGNFSTTNPYDLNGGGSLNYGGTLNGTVHGTTNKSNLVNPSIFTTQQTASINQSNNLAALKSNATLNTSDQNNWSLNYGSTGNNKQYIVDVTAAQLAGFNGNPVTLSLGSFNSTDTLVFDVAGNTVSHFGITINANGLQNRILWNFNGASTVNIDNRELEGSVLAPTATVDQSNVIEGTLIAKNWVTQNGPEIHTETFTGVATPEPSSYALVGMGIVGLLFRRKRASAL